MIDRRLERADLVVALCNYAQRWPREWDTVQRIIDFVEQNPGCFNRSTLVGHITGSAWIVSPTNDKTLLLHHRKLDKWLQPGGHADGDGNILRVAITEAREETGINEFDLVIQDIFDVDIHTIPERRGEPQHLHYDIRYALRARTMDVIVSEESNALQWINIPQIESLTKEPSMIRMAHKWLQYQHD